MAGVIFDPESKRLVCPKCLESVPAPGSEDFPAHMVAMFKFAQSHIIHCDVSREKIKE